MDAGVAPREEALCASVAELLAPPDGVLALSAGRSRIATSHGAVKLAPGATKRCHHSKHRPAMPRPPRRPAPLCCCAAHLHLPNMATRSTMLRLLCALVLCAAVPDDTARPPPR